MRKQMVRCAREDRATVPSAMIHILECTVDHGRFVRSCQQACGPPKSVTVSRKEGIGAGEASTGLCAATTLGVHPRTKCRARRLPGRPTRRSRDRGFDGGLRCRRRNLNSHPQRNDCSFRQ